MNFLANFEGILFNEREYNYFRKNILERVLFTLYTSASLRDTINNSQIKKHHTWLFLKRKNTMIKSFHVVITFKSQNNKK